MLSQRPIFVIFVVAVVAPLVAQTRAGSRVPVAVFLALSDRYSTWQEFMFLLARTRPACPGRVRIVMEHRIHWYQAVSLLYLLIRRGAASRVSSLFYPFLGHRLLLQSCAHGATQQVSLDFPFQFVEAAT